MASFKTTSLADQVFEKLENDIILGVYPPGEVLTELRLAEQLGVSRTPVREALRRLEQEQLIENTGNGSVVIGITFEALQDILDILLCRSECDPGKSAGTAACSGPAGILLHPQRCRPSADHGRQFPRADL